LQEFDEIGQLQASKQRCLSVLIIATIALVFFLAMRFFSPWNDALSGEPEYVRVLTEGLAKQLAAVDPQRPIIVQKNESGPCPQVKGPGVPNEEIQDSFYVLTYSEKQRITCFTTYAVPADAAKFSNAHTVRPGLGKNYGASLLGPVRAVAINNVSHQHSPEYLRWLHWRFQPHFPLSQSEAANLAGRADYSGAEEGNVSGTRSTNLEVNLEEARAEVAKPHESANLVLALLLGSITVLLLATVWRLGWIYTAVSRYFCIYHSGISVGDFLGENLSQKMDTERRRYIEQRRRLQEQDRERERLRLVLVQWEENLRAILPRLTDDELRRRIQECLEAPELEQLKGLWIETQEQLGQKSPADKLGILVESIRPYCTEEELQACRTEVFAVLRRTGFREARKLAITMHDRFKLRAREIEELEREAS
jgi:hypothetical protein